MKYTSSIVTPFEPGAPPHEGFIPLCVPEIRGNEWKYIKECLDTNFVSSVGPFVNRFEMMVADYVGCKYGVATVNGTAALHISLLVAGVQPNDEVLVSTLTFIAPANAIRYVDAWPVFIDAEPDFWQMDPQKVVDFLEKKCEIRNGTLYNKLSDRRVKAILPVHILGHPVDMDPIIKVAKKYNLVVIEDASESLGAKYKGRMVGNLGDITCFSFNGNKLITTGGGGMIVTNNEEWASRAKYLTTQAKDDPIEYIHNEIGYNYRLTNIQAAMGVAQLEQIEKTIAIKRVVADVYHKGLKKIQGITLMSEASWAISTFWLYTILIDESKFWMNNMRLLQDLNDKGIQSRPLWQPIHLSPAHSGGKQVDECNISEKLNKKALSLPCSIGLTSSNQQKVINQISSIKKYS